jgi:hypothetical protein
VKKALYRRRVVKSWTQLLQLLNCWIYNDYLSLWLNYYFIIIFLFLNCFDVFILKIIFLKYYFNIFLNNFYHSYTPKYILQVCLSLPFSLFMLKMVIIKFFVCWYANRGRLGKQKAKMRRWIQTVNAPT